MVKEFKYNKLVDPEQLHKQIANAGFNILGVMYDEGKNQTTIMLDDSETNDPTSIVEAYVYVEPVLPNYPVLYANAQQTVQDALIQYNTAVTNYITATNAFNAATTNAGKINATEDQVKACASAISAAKDAITALVQVVTVLAKNNNVVQEDE